MLYVLLASVLWIRFILIWIRILRSVSWYNGSGSCSESDLKSRKYQFKKKFYKKNISPKKIICFVIYGVNYLCPLNISLIFLKKKFDILMILVDFCGNFPWFWLIFCYPDPDETDPDPQHWFPDKCRFLVIEVYLPSLAVITYVSFWCTWALLNCF